MGNVHTTKDKKIKRKELTDTEKLLNAHCVAWGKMWGSGDNHDHRGRIVNSKKTNSENFADMYILLKDHKKGEKTIKGPSETFNEFVVGLKHSVIKNVPLYLRTTFSSGPKRSRKNPFFNHF